MPDGGSRPADQTPWTQTPTPQRTPSVAVIQDAVCWWFSVTRWRLLSSRKDHLTKDARHAAIWLAREYSYPLTHIAGEFNMSVAGARYAAARMDAHIQTGPGFVRLALVTIGAMIDAAVNGDV